jgi:hypothetical protein
LVLDDLIAHGEAIAEPGVVLKPVSF